MPTKKSSATKKPTKMTDGKTAARARSEALKARAEAAKAHAAKLRTSPLAGFIEFIREKGVVGLAVGLAIGSASTILVTQMVASVITPLVGLIVGKNGLDGLNVTVKIADRSEVFAFGDFIDALIKFIAIAAVIYFVVMGLRLDRLDKKKEA